VFSIMGIFEALLCDLHMACNSQLVQDLGIMGALHFYTFGAKSRRDVLFQTLDR